HRRQAENRLRIIAEASRQFLASLDVGSVLATLADLVVPDIADVCFIDVIGEDDAIERLPPVIAPEYANAVSALLARVSTQGGPVGRVIHSGRPLLVEQITEDMLDRALEDEGSAKGIDALPFEPGSAMVVPILGLERPIATLTAGTMGNPGRRLTSEDLELVEELARRAASAAENARLFSAQREAAETLQHSLLPDSLPQLPSIELGARYRAGGPGTDVGGDWYDVMTLPDGSIGLVMGDVVGRGIAAASLMGQLRHSLRAFAHARLSPGEALTELN